MKKLLFALTLGLLSAASLAGPKEIAWKMHNRIAGVPPQPDTLHKMADLISAGQAESAARIAMAHPDFINTVLKNWIKPWSNRDLSPRVEMNDYVATIMGVIRDDDFKLPDDPLGDFFFQTTPQRMEPPKVPVQLQALLHSGQTTTKFAQRLFAAGGLLFFPVFPTYQKSLPLFRPKSPISGTSLL